MVAPGRTARRALTAFMLGMSPAPAVSARDLETALDHVRAGEAAEAVAIFRDLALAGDSAAQVNLAVMHARGEGVPLDIEEASYWAWRARLMGEARAAGPSEALIARLPERQRGTLATRLAADLEMLAEEGRFRAFVGLGLVELEVRMPKDPRRAALWFTLAAAFEEPHAIRLRGYALAEVAEPDRLAIQAEARTLFAEWCERLPRESVPPSCPVIMARNEP
ncbi:MAG: sel1 repeat family protein [Pseudomonadota bacterium]